MKTNEIQPNSIEIWAQLAEELFNNSCIPLNDDQAKGLIKLIMSEGRIEKEEITNKLDNEKLGLASLFYKRVKHCHTFKITNAVALFIGIYIANSPGEAVMFSNYIQYKAFKNGCRNVNMDFICTNVFPMGVPTEQALSTVWDLQKVERGAGSFESDNLLDYAKGQETITFK